MLSRITLAALVVLAAAPTVARSEDPSADELKTTITRTRDIGTALFSWLTDQDTVPAGGEETESYDWTRCPPLSHAEATALLVPTYIAAVPRVDGWGHPFELCLRREGAGLVVGIRSPGRDGRFDGTQYSVGKFDPTDLDRDVVWIDGYFVRWPQR